MLTMPRDWFPWRRLLCHHFRQMFESLRGFPLLVAICVDHEPGLSDRKYRNYRIQSGWPCIFSWRVPFRQSSVGIVFLSSSSPFSLRASYGNHLDLQEVFLSFLGSRGAHHRLRKMQDPPPHLEYCHIQREKVFDLQRELGEFFLHAWPILLSPCRWRYRTLWNTHFCLTSVDGRAIFLRSIYWFYSQKLYNPIEYRFKKGVLSSRRDLFQS